MLGSASTQQVFASAQSIQITPTVYAEWNYNRIIQPYAYSSNILSPDSLSALSASLSSFTSTDSITVSSSTTTSDSFLPLGSNFSRSYKIFKHFRTAQDDSSTVYDRFYGKAYSIANITNSDVLVSYADDSYFKIVFWVRANINSSTSAPTKISSIQTSTASSSTSLLPADTYTYSVRAVGYDGTVSDAQTATVAVASGYYPTLTWGYSSLSNIDSSAVSFDIYRRSNTYNKLKYITSIANDYTGSITFSDNLNYPYLPNNISTFVNYLTITPTIDFLYNNYIVSGEYFVKSYAGDKENISDDNSVNVSSAEWTKIEVWCKAKYGTSANKVRLNLTANAAFQNFSFFFYNVELYKVSKNEYIHYKDVSMQSVFSPSQPGEALLNPLLPDADKTIYDYDSNLDSSYQSQSRQPSFLYYQNTAAYSYKIGDTKIIENYDKFKYYFDIESININPAQSIMSTIARYPTPISINKIVLKYLNTGWSGTIAANVVVRYFDSNGNKQSTSFGTTNINDPNGTLIFACDGTSPTSWSKISASSFVPPQLTASGSFPSQSVLKNVYEISINFYAINNDYVENAQVKGFHLIECSPRLELDVSNITESISVSKETDGDISAMFPIGITNANSGNISLTNIPISLTLPHSNPTSMFDNNASTATFYGLMRQGVKFTAFYTSPRGDFTEKIPAFCMYSQNWSINNYSNVAVSLYDYTKSNLMSSNAPSIALNNNSFFYAIYRFLNACGYSDYDYAQLKSATKFSPNLTAFYSNESQTVSEVIQELFKAAQIYGSVDEYGIMRFGGIDYNINAIYDSNFKPDFIVTDQNKSIVTMHSNGASISYTSNAIEDSYQETVGEKVGKLIVRYVDVEKSQSEDSVINPGTFNNYKSISYETAVWTENKSSVLDYATTQSVLAGSSNISLSSDSQNKLNQQIGSFSGEAFLGAEIIGYNGVKHTFVGGATTESNFAVPISKITYNAYAASSGFTGGSGVVTVTANSTQSPPYADVYKVANNGLSIGDVVNLSSLTGTASSLNSKVFDVKDVSDTPTIQGTSGSITFTIENTSTASSITNISLGNGTASIGYANSSNRIIRTFSSSDSDNIPTITRTIFSPSDIYEGENIFFNSFPQATSVQVVPTGQLANIVRGKYGTLIKDHPVLDSNNISTYFVKTQIQPANTRTSNYPLAALQGSINDDSSLKIVSSSSAILEAIYPKTTLTNWAPTNNTNFFSVMFKSNEIQKPRVTTRGVKYYQPHTQQKVGLFFNLNPAAGANPNYTTFISARPQETGNSKNALTTVIELFTFDSRGNISAFNDYTTLIVNRDLFDGKMHKLAAYFKNKNIYIYIDDEWINVAKSDNYLTFNSGTTAYSALAENTTGNAFGAFAQTLDSSAISVDVYEIYACRWVLDANGNEDTANKTLYHFLTRTFLNSVLSGDSTSLQTDYLLWQNKPVLRGIKNYKEWFSPAPVDVINGKVKFNVPKYGATAEGKNYSNVDSGKVYGAVDTTDYAYSDISKNAFRWSGIIANNGSKCVRPHGSKKTNTAQGIWLGTQNGNIAEGVSITPLQITGAYVNLSDPQKIYELVLDANSLSTSIDISSNWIHGRQSAEKIAYKISKLLSGYYSTINIDIFGNPLIQTGDICYLNYSLKGLTFDQNNPSSYPLRFFAKKVQVNFEGGLTTSLELKPVYVK